MGNDTAATGTGFMTPFILGAIAGAGVALLYAPCSGKEARDLLVSKGRKLKDRTQEALHEAGEYISGKRADLASAVHSGKKAMREEMGREA